MRWGADGVCWPPADYVLTCRRCATCGYVRADGSACPTCDDELFPAWEDGEGPPHQPQDQVRNTKLKRPPLPLLHLFTLPKCGARSLPQATRAYAARGNHCAATEKKKALPDHRVVYFLRVSHVQQQQHQHQQGQPPPPPRAPKPVLQARPGALPAGAGAEGGRGAASANHPQLDSSPVFPPGSSPRPSSGFHSAAQYAHKAPPGLGRNDNSTSSNPNNHDNTGWPAAAGGGYTGWADSGVPVLDSGDFENELPGSIVDNRDLSSTSTSTARSSVVSNV